MVPYDPILLAMSAKNTEPDLGVVQSGSFFRSSGPKLRMKLYTSIYLLNHMHHVYINLIFG